MSSARITALRPPLALEGGRVTIEGGPFHVESGLPQVTAGGEPARVVFASSSRVVFVVPPGGGGPVPLRVEGVTGETPILHTGELVARGIHQVDNPAIDAEGAVYLTFSGSRGQQGPVSIYRVRGRGPREIFASGIINPTSLAFDPGGRLHVSSRFEGAVFAVGAEGQLERVAHDLGIACGLALHPDGTIYVGDRSGTIFRVGPGDATSAVATLPSSVAAYHLALTPDGGALYVSVPTLASHDAVYRIALPGGEVTRLPTRFGRPQGLAFDPAGRLHVVEALAGASGIYRLDDDGAPELVLAGEGLVGLAFGPRGEIVVTSNEQAWRIGPAAPASHD
jgi:sugar lactone lactonase YvrE